VSTTPQDQSDRERSIRLMRARKSARARTLRRKERRAEAIKRGVAVTVTPREYAELSGLSLYTVYRRVWNDPPKLRFKRDGGRILIFADQLG
jgi:hypothetical protein